MKIVVETSHKSEALLINLSQRHKLRFELGVTVNLGLIQKAWPNRSKQEKKFFDTGPKHLSVV